MSENDTARLPPSPPPPPSSPSSAGDLSVSVGKLSLSCDTRSDTSSGNFSGDSSPSGTAAFPPSASSTQTQTLGLVIDRDRNQLIRGLANGGAVPVAPPLYPQDMWTSQGLVAGAIHPRPAGPPPGFAAANGGIIGARGCAIGERLGRIGPCSLDGQGLRGLKFREFARSQEGSKECQEVMRPRDPKITQLMFEKVMDYCGESPIFMDLMTTQYGWHVFARLVCCCNDQQLELITSKLITHITTVYEEGPDGKLKSLLMDALSVVSRNNYGSNSIKKLITVLRRSPLVSLLTHKLTTMFIELMEDATGSYVIMHCLDQLDTAQCEPLYKAAIDNCLVIAGDKRGCISLNQFIDGIQGPSRNVLLQIISNNAAFLAQEPHGNYVVQKVLSLQNPYFTNLICNQFRNIYATLAVQKGGSHVVEKVLNSSMMEHAVQGFLSLSPSVLAHVARDRFGNFVIQTALKATKRAGSPLHERLLMKLKQLPNLQGGFGRNILMLITNGVPINEDPIWKNYQ